MQASGLTTLQVNLGKVCNQTCRHCHVDAGPERLEQMTQETMGLCLEVLAQAGIPVLDVTGGAQRCIRTSAGSLAKPGDGDARCSIAAT